jgi:hypothetical protein
VKGEDDILCSKQAPDVEGTGKRAPVAPGAALRTGHVLLLQLGEDVAQAQEKKLLAEHVQGLRGAAERDEDQQAADLTNVGNVQGGEGHLVRRGKGDEANVEGVGPVVEGVKVVGQVPRGALDDVQGQHDQDERQHNDDADKRHEVELLPDLLLPDCCHAAL